MEKENIEEVFPLASLGVVGFKILLLIYNSKEKRKYIRQITFDGKIGFTSIYRALSVLADYGLIYYESVHGRKFVVLTNYGEKVAELLSKANSLIIEAKNKRLSNLT